MTLEEAMDFLARGFKVKRKPWIVWLFGPMHPCINEPHDGSVWFNLPEKCGATDVEMWPGYLGSEWEDDSYAPTEIDIAATDWEVER